MKPDFELNKIRLFNCDCMEFMKEVPYKYYELAIVDPEYGGNDAIGLKDCKDKTKQATTRTKYKVFKNKPPKKQYFEELFRISKNQIIWGVNFYKNIDLSGGRLVWDKKGTVFGRAELAYLSMTKSINIVEIEWNGMIQHNMKEKEIRIHPTQKPVALYKWLLTNYAKEGDKIFDSHGGSFSSAIACLDYGFQFDGCELDKEYFENAVNRIKKHNEQITIDWSKL